MTWFSRRLISAFVFSLSSLFSIPEICKPLASLCGYTVGLYIILLKTSMAGFSLDETHIFLGGCSFGPTPPANMTTIATVTTDATGNSCQNQKGCLFRNGEAVIDYLKFDKVASLNCSFKGSGDCVKFSHRK